MEPIPIVAGPSVEGHITFLSESDYTVEMTKPYPGLSTGWHIPYFMMSYKKRYNQNSETYAYCDANGTLQMTPYCAESARRDLLTIVRACKAVERCQRALRRECTACSARILNEYAWKAAAANEAFYPDRAALLQAKEAGRWGRGEYIKKRKNVDEMERAIDRTQYDIVTQSTGVIGGVLVKQLIFKYALDKSLAGSGHPPANPADPNK